jgi:hypothetical protein
MISSMDHDPGTAALVPLLSYWLDEIFHPTLLVSIICNHPAGTHPLALVLMLVVNFLKLWSGKLSRTASFCPRLVD